MRGDPSTGCFLALVYGDPAFQHRAQRQNLGSGASQGIFFLSFLPPRGTTRERSLGLALWWGTQRRVSLHIQSSLRIHQGISGSSEETPLPIPAHSLTVAAPICRGGGRGGDSLLGEAFPVQRLDDHRNR